MNREKQLDVAGRTVLLATDGSAAAQSATRVAAALAERHDARIHVLSVVDTRPTPVPFGLGMAVELTDVAIGEAVHEQQGEVLRAKISELIHRSCDWPVSVKLGAPAQVIVSEATHLDAVLVILGLQRHGKLERALGDETAVSVMRSASCPVIGVVEGMATLPALIVAAMDFSSASVRAASAASAIAAEGSMLMLAYVPPITTFAPEDGEHVIHELGVQAAFERIATQLARPGLRIEYVVLPHEASHPVSSVLLEYANDKRAELIAAGSARHSRVDRWMIGSVSTELVRDGRKSVLIVPPWPER